VLEQERLDMHDKRDTLVTTRATRTRRACRVVTGRDATSGIWAKSLQLDYIFRQIKVAVTWF